VSPIEINTSSTSAARCICHDRDFLDAYRRKYAAQR
jgi:hypothetical protein